MRAAVQAVARVVAGPDDRPDGDLVAAFLRHGDGPAFAALVRRHGPMVLRVCRRVAGNAHDAEDAAQAAFLVLARQARSIRRTRSVAAWLHGVAVRVARKARTRADRQYRRERAAARPEGVRPDDPSWAEVRGVLDDELARLPDRYRQPLVLCYLQGRTRDEAAKALGWSPATLGRRLEAARAALGRRLRARGVAGAAALPAVLVSDAATGGTFPPALIAACVDHALAVTGRSGTLLPPAVAELCQGVTRAMTMTRTLFFGVLAAGVVAAAGVYAARPSESAPIPLPPAAARPAADPKPPFGLERVAVDEADFVSFHKLDVFRYRAAIPQGQRFTVVLRELHEKDKPARELCRFPFRRVAADGRTTIRVDFVSYAKDTMLLGPVLLADKNHAVFWADCPGCDPLGMTQFITVPLWWVKPAERVRRVYRPDDPDARIGEKGVRLVSVARRVAGQAESEYPRAELLIEFE
jgi:RNA polymerase sigma factor (sigma-70 family)